MSNDFIGSIDGPTHLAVVQEKERLRQRYEELRSVIDDGSESMTHEDAVGEVKGMRQRIEELEAELNHQTLMLEEERMDRLRLQDRVIELEAQ